MALKLAKKNSFVAATVGAACLLLVVSVVTAQLKTTVTHAITATFTVTTTADSGPGSLRQAITDSNATPSLPTSQNLIEFNIPGSGVQSIALQTELPQITQPVIIDGTTQAGSSCGNLVPQNTDGTIGISNTPHTLLVEVSSATVVTGAAALGLTSTAAGSVVKGLVLNGSQNASFYNLSVAAPNATIECSYIGTNPTGNVSISHAGAGGIYIQPGANNVSIRQNLLSGNGQFGLHAQSVASLLVERNLIGTDVSGQFALGNENAAGTAGSGISIVGTNQADIYKNVLSGNKEFGITGGWPAPNTATKIRGNYIGANLSGMAGLRNESAGIMITIVGNSVVGGDTPDDRNVVGPSSGPGMRFNGADSVTIQGNYIGVGADGRTSLGTVGVAALYLGYGESNITVGGSLPGQGNVIGNSTWMGFVADGPLTNVTVQGNYFGATKYGDPLPIAHTAFYDSSQGVIKFGGSNPGEGNVVGSAGYYGIWMRGDTNIVEGNYVGVTPDNKPIPNAITGMQFEIAATIGGSIQSAGNTIAYNPVGIDAAGANMIITNNKIHDNDIGITVPYNKSIAIRQNSIYNNASLGIDLNSDGSTPNDPLDLDTGPNNLQNYPVIVSSMTKCDGTTDTRNVPMFNSTPNITFTIDYYANPSWDPNGTAPRQGEQWHSSQTVTTDANGDATLAIPNITYPSVTATAPDGSTSEFGSINNMQFNDCQDMGQRVVADTTKNINLSAGWTGSNIPSTYYQNQWVYDSASNQWSQIPQKSGLQVSITVGGQPFIADPTDPNQGSYSLSNNGWSAFGHTSTPLPEGTYDVVLTLTDPTSGLSMTKTYKDAVKVALPKVTYTTTITNNQTPALTGAAADVSSVYSAYIVPAGTVIDPANPPKERALRYSADVDASGNNLPTGTWKVITNKQEYITLITQEYAAQQVDEEGYWQHNFAQWYFGDIVANAPSITTLDGLKSMCTDSAV